MITTDKTRGGRPDYVRPDLLDDGGAHIFFSYKTQDLLFLFLVQFLFYPLWFVSHFDTTGDAAQFLISHVFFFPPMQIETIARHSKT